MTTELEQQRQRFADLEHELRDAEQKLNQMPPTKKGETPNEELIHIETHISELRDEWTRVGKMIESLEQSRKLQQHQRLLEVPMVGPNLRKVSLPVIKI